MSSALLRLQAWLSPAFPTGGFAYSHGLEWAVDAGEVRDGPTLQAWVGDVLAQGSGRNDTILLRQAHRVCADPAALAEVAELALATAPCRERRLEALDQGRAFLAAAAPWGAGLGAKGGGGAATSGSGDARQSPTVMAGAGRPSTTLPAAPTQDVDGRPAPAMTGKAAASSSSASASASSSASASASASAASSVPPSSLPFPADSPYCVAVGAVAGRHGVPEDATAAAYLQAFAANLISAAVRLVPLGQTTGLQVLAALEPVILATAAATASADLDDLGGCAFRSDLAAMRHETQYTRLFRS